MDEKYQSADHMAKHPQNRWGSVHYDDRFDIYWVKAGGAKQQLFYCPWCGEKLPESQRRRWFDELDERGIDPADDDFPDEYKSGAWRGVNPEYLPSSYDGGPIEGRYIDFFDLEADDDKDE